MKDAKLATSRLRETLHYVSGHRNSTFVIAYDGRVLEQSDLLSVAGDISLLHEIGIRLVLVIGSSDQSDYRGRRKTKSTLQGLAKELCRYINNVHYRFLKLDKAENEESGDFARIVNSDGITPDLSAKKAKEFIGKGLMPVIIAAPQGETIDASWFDWLLRVIVAVCNEILTDKLIYLSSVDGMFQKGKVLLREAQPAEVRQMVVDGVVTGQFAEFASTAERVIEAGVTRVHFINGKVPGVLLREVFTRDGVGTMIYKNPYQEIRPARQSDIVGIQGVLDTNGTRGQVRRRSEEIIEAQLENYRVVVKDEEVIACGKLCCFPNERKALISSLAVNPSYLSNGTGELLLQKLTDEAGGNGTTLLTLLSPKIGQWWLGKKFATGTISDLPSELQKGVGPGTIVLKQHLE